MVNVEMYYNDILSKNTKNRIKRNIVLRIISSLIFIITCIIGFSFMGVGVVLNFIKEDSWLQIYIIGVIVFAIGLIPFMILESIDIIENYSTNKKLFIYLYMLRLSLNNLKEKNKYSSFFYNIYIKEIIRDVYRQTQKVDNNLKNLFIVEASNDVIKLMDNLLNVFNSKLFIMIKEFKIDIVINLIESLVGLYEVSIINNIANDIEYKKTLQRERQNFKIEKLKILYKVLNEIDKECRINRKYTIIYKIKRFFLNRYFISAIIIFICITSIYFLNVTKTAELITLLTGIPGIIAFVVSINKNRDK